MIARRIHRLLLCPNLLQVSVRKLRVPPQFLCLLPRSGWGRQGSAHHRPAGFLNLHLRLQARVLHRPRGNRARDWVRLDFRTVWDFGRLKVTASATSFRLVHDAILLDRYGARPTCSPHRGVHWKYSPHTCATKGCVLFSQMTTHPCKQDRPLLAQRPQPMDAIEQSRFCLRFLIGTVSMLPCREADAGFAPCFLP